MLAVLSLCLACSDAHAQQFTFRKYGQPDGLTSLATSCLIQDHAGFVWTCTENGLFRYDGGEFRNYGASAGLVQANIRALVEDASNRLWVGTASDLYLGKDGQFAPVRPGGRSLSIEPGARIVSLEANHTLVIEKGVLLDLRWSEHESWQARPYFTAAQLLEHPELGKLTALLADASGGLWLGCGEHLCEIRPNLVRVWDRSAGVPEETWHTMLVDRRGQLWARGSHHAVVLARGAAHFEHRDPPGGAITSSMRYMPLAEDADGRILTRTAEGLARWSDGGGWQSFGVANGLPLYELFGLLVDREGALWMSVTGHGLSRWLGYGNWEAWTANQGLDLDIVWSLLRDSKQQLVLGARPGCRLLAPGAARFTPCRAAGLPNGEITAIAKDSDGTLVAALPGGKIFRIDLSHKLARQVASLPPPVVQIALDHHQRLWALTGEGPFLLEDRKGKGPWRATNPSADGAAVTDVVEDSHGVLWFASLSGLLRLSHDKWRLLKIDDDHARVGFSQILTAGDGWLWMASSSRGLLRAHVKGDTVEQWEWVKDPLIANASLLFLQTDKRGWLWVGTDAGVVVYDGRQWRRFSQADGLIWNDVDQNAFLADADGSVWIGTSGGLSHILHPEKLLGVSPLTASVSRVTFGSRALPEDTSKPLSWRGDAALNLHVSSMNPSQSESAVFRHRLVGLSDEWFETRNPDVNYPALGPGHYRFEVVAFNGDRGLESPPAALAFTIAPPWWRTPLFYTVLAVVIATTVTLLWRWRVRLIVAGQKLRERQLHEREALLERATRDALTGLWNRAVILDHLAQEMALAVKTGAPLALVIIDIDHFKHINDSYGHLVGDQVLRTLGAHLSKMVRASDHVGRYGGEEFLVVMPGMTEACPSEMVERLRQSISEIEIAHQAIGLRVTASFGVAWLAPERDSVDILIGRADRSLYAAKRGGRNRVEYSRVSDPVAPVERQAITRLADLA